MDSEKSKSVEKDAPNEEIADFEKAIDATGFGILNIFMLFVTITSTFANAFATSTMAYILPIAECDLRLSLYDKGVLNGSTYAGMIVSSLIWGYLADTKGRRKLLIVCYLIDAICVLGSSVSQNTESLITFKFLGGFMVNGPSAILYTYLTEMHGSKTRPRIIMMLGMSMALANICLSLLAWAVFPRDWNFVLFDFINVHSWQIFLLICCLPSFISGLSYIFLPESPKFLMSQGRNAEALRAFQKMYAFNTRKPRETYPIKQLVEEVPSRDVCNVVSDVIFTIEDNISNEKKIKEKKIKRQPRTLSQSINDGIEQVKPLFHKPLLGQSIYVYVLQFCILYGLNTIRLWLPQLFASISEYEDLHSLSDQSPNMCNILEYSVNKTATVLSNYNERCAVRYQVPVNMYINNVIVAVTGFVCYALAGSIIRFISVKRLMVCGLFISGCLAISLYWSGGSRSTLVISSLYLAVASVSTMSLLGAIALLFPTSLRTIVIACSLMFGRLGALSGNMVFPFLIEWGCIQPFLIVGIVMLTASGLSFFLPSTKRLTFT